MRLVPRRSVASFAASAWLALLVAQLLAHASPAEAGNGEPGRKSRTAQAYSTYREEEGVPSQFDNRDDAARYESLDELTRHLIRTAAAISKYRLPDAMPMVTRIERAELERRGCPEHSPHCQVAALYEPARGIMIAADLEPETNLFHRSILLHELVHYLQDVGQELATASPCDRWYQREIEAYTLQNRFLSSVSSPERVSYAGARPTCESPVTAQTHRAREVKVPDVNNH
jgi:hypothetical protein